MIEGVVELLRMQDGGCHPIDGCYFPGNPYAGADFRWRAANTVSGAAGIEGWDCLDEAEAANAPVPELQARGVEAIVVLIHEGGSQNPAPGEVNACNDISGPIVAIDDALDPAITSVIDKWQPLCDAAGNTAIGTITSDTTRGGVPTGSDRSVESVAGSPVADAHLLATSADFADVAFMDPGGVRSDLMYAESAGEGDGVVTFGKAFTFQPFGNTLVTMAMTGRRSSQCSRSSASHPGRVGRFCISGCRTDSPTAWTRRSLPAIAPLSRSRSSRSTELL